MAKNAFTYFVINEHNEIQNGTLNYLLTLLLLHPTVSKEKMKTDAKLFCDKLQVVYCEIEIK
jgi:hypothetical protein